MRATFNYIVIYEGLRIVNVIDEDYYLVNLKILQNSSFRGATNINIFQLKYYNEIYANHSVKLLKEGMFNVLQGLLVPRHNILFEDLNNQIKILFEAEVDRKVLRDSTATVAWTINAYV